MYMPAVASAQSIRDWLVRFRRFKHRMTTFSFGSGYFKLVASEGTCWKAFY